MNNQCYTAPDGTLHVYREGIRVASLYSRHNLFWSSLEFANAPAPVRDHDGERIYIFLIDPETIMTQIDIDASLYPSMRKLHHGNFETSYRIDDVDLALLRLQHRVKVTYGENNAKA